MTNEKDKKNLRAVGRHKQAVACVELTQGQGKIMINNQETVDFNQNILKPLQLVGIDQKYNIAIKVSGGGIIGQMKAISLAIARAALKSDENLKATLKKSGFLRRDPRVKERKKYGLKSARRAPQWSKR